MKYVEKYGGYIADVPTVIFKRCDGKVFLFNELNSFSVSFGREKLEIRGGQFRHALAVIDTTHDIQISLESAIFDTDLFLLDQPKNYGMSKYSILESKRFCVKNGMITIPHQVEEGTISTIYDGIQSIDYLENKTILHVNPEDKDLTIRLNYNRIIPQAVVAKSKITKYVTGTLGVTYPVYATNDDCTENPIRGYVNIKIWKVRVTSKINISSSYKSATTFSLEMMGIDAHRHDGRIYEIMYEPTFKVKKPYPSFDVYDGELYSTVPIKEWSALGYAPIFELIDDAQLQIDYETDKKDIYQIIDGEMFLTRST